MDILATREPLETLAQQEHQVHQDTRTAREKQESLDTMEEPEQKEQLVLELQESMVFLDWLELLDHQVTLEG